MVLFVSDLDGTLLNDVSEIDKVSLETLNRLIENGVHFTIATARAFPAIRSILEGLELKLPVIEQNGAMLRDFSTGQVIEAKLMASRDVATVCEVFDHHKVDPLVSVLEGDKNSVLYNRIDNPGMDWAVTTMRDVKYQRDLIVCDNHDTVVSSAVLLFRYLGSEIQIKEMANKISTSTADISVSHFHNYFTDGWEINISSIEANKGHALKTLRPYANGISKIVAFGDNDNDMDMFHHADESYAVANATPAIRNKATATIGMNTDNAVVGYIEQRVSDILSGRKP